jgi:hypothetical protein
MMQKLLIGGLVLGIVAVIGFGLIDAGRVPQDVEPVALVATPIPSRTPAPTAAVIPTTAAIEATEEAIAELGPIVQAQGAMGTPWQAEGTISVLEDFGFTLTTADGDFYVELGPPTYWQAQGIPLAVGDTIQVDGYFNGEQVHARVVTANGAELVIRTESGQPMWAGGADHTAGTDQQGAGQMQSQVAPEDWLTLTGTIGNVTNGQVILAVNDGTTLSLQMGRPDFWQSQGITLSVGDSVEVLGFWSGDQFMAGDIRKTATGETIMLRDPNGRQLWAGPGRGRQGQQGEGQGGGNGYRGGREG